ncbi:hypothetical protein EYF80_055109 [Liparis tanakae]|uniref:Uncharacterized protein n=1 Tax=Liparis tanakae TaxID=230148 RepID=A0A4Z2F0J7_9TELE|nr:hypothetical protein EYF80_055109 [Liparis tanakae]
MKSRLPLPTHLALSPVAAPLWSGPARLWSAPLGADRPPTLWTLSCSAGVERSGGAAASSPASAGARGETTRQTGASDPTALRPDPTRPRCDPTRPDRVLQNSPLAAVASAASLVFFPELCPFCSRLARCRRSAGLGFWIASIQSAAPPLFSAARCSLNQRTVSVSPGRSLGPCAELLQITCFILQTSEATAISMLVLKMNMRMKYTRFKE